MRCEKNLDFEYDEECTDKEDPCNIIGLYAAPNVLLEIQATKWWLRDHSFELSLFTLNKK